MIPVKVTVSVCEAGLKLHYPFDPESERTLHRSRREQREAQDRNLAIMQNNVEQDHGKEKNEPQGGHNGNNGRNQAPRPFI